MDPKVTKTGGEDFLIYSSQPASVFGIKKDITTPTTPEVVNKHLKEMVSFFQKDANQFTPLAKDTGSLASGGTGESTTSASTVTTPSVTLQPATSAPTATLPFKEKEVYAHFIDDKGNLTPEGVKLYRQIQAEFLDPVPKHDIGKPVMYFTGGIAASGKSSMIRRMLGDKPDVVWVDPDEIKKTIIKNLATSNPEMRKAMEEEKDWASVVHEVSSFMSKRLTFDAIQSGKDILFDGTMGNPAKYLKLAQDAKTHGYTTKALVNEVTPETAIVRMEKRAEKPVIVKLDNGETVTLQGRRVPVKDIHEQHGKLIPTVTHLIKNGAFDSCTIFNNDDNPTGGPVILATYTREKGLSKESTGIKSPVLEGLEKELTGV